MDARAHWRRTSDPAAAAAGVLALAVPTILAALAFEHVGGYLPCPLCLEQRHAYYAGIPLAIAAFGLARGGRPGLARLTLAAIALGFVVNAGLGVYHSGIEWGWWPGPAACAVAQGVTPEAGALLSSLSATRVVACDEAAWRLLGLSFAGWNAVVSAVLAALAVGGALARPPRSVSP